MDVSLVFGVQDVPSETLASFEYARGIQFRRGGMGSSKRGEAVQPLLAWCGMEFHDLNPNGVWKKHLLLVKTVSTKYDMAIIKSQYN